MTNTTLNVLSQPDETGTDVLTALLRNGARQLIAQAVEVELQQLLQAHEELRLPLLSVVFSYGIFQKLKSLWEM